MFAPAANLLKPALKGLTLQKSQNIQNPNFNDNDNPNPNFNANDNPNPNSNYNYNL
jgi:hypothetical protein